MKAGKQEIITQELRRGYMTVVLRQQFYLNEIVARGCGRHIMKSGVKLITAGEYLYISHFATNALPNSIDQCRKCEGQSIFFKSQWRPLMVYSCYASPSVTIAQYEEILDSFVLDFRCHSDFITWVLEWGCRIPGTKSYLKLPHSWTSRQRVRLDRRLDLH